MEKELKVIEEREIITTKEDIDKNNPAYFENNENENNENREFYVYEHIRLDNMTCFYVGKGKGDRIDVLTRNKHHDNVSDKYGHVAVIIKDNLTEEEAFELERDIIEYYVFTLGYGIDIKGYRNIENNEFLTNMTFGGEGVSGIKRSEEHKKKISEANRGRKRSEETRKKISEGNKGKKQSEEAKRKISKVNKGRKRSEEAKRKISELIKGKHHSEEVRKKMSESHKRIQFSEETKLKMSESNKGKNNPMYGKHHSEETKLKMSESHKGKLSKKVICVTTGEIFNSQTEASNYYNVVQKNISCCCRGRLKSAGKLRNRIKLQWKFLEDYNNEFKGILINPITE